MNPHASSSHSPSNESGQKVPLSTSEQEIAKIDLHRVLVEIEEEVRAKRASGELSTELERELDMAFARLAPAGAVAGDFEQLLERADSQAFVDLIAPNESVRPGVPHIKRVVQKAMRWYIRYIAEQFTGFAHTITKAMRQLGDRLTVVEQMTVPVEEYADLSVYDTQWDERIVALFSGTRGRVLHARCGTGKLTKSLVDSGVDAYGVDPSTEAIAVGIGNADIDLRPDDEREHLRNVSAAALGGLILTGSVDALPRGAQVELVNLAALTLQKGAPLIMVTTNPQAWERSRSPVQVDLSPGRPLHPETWKHLLENKGFTEVTIEASEGQGGLQIAANKDITTANFSTLNDLLFPPTSYLMVAYR